MKYNPKIVNFRKNVQVKTVMLTGDAKKVADQVAASLGIDEVHSELLPGDKVSKVEELQGMKSGKAKLAFVGDGINELDFCWFIVAFFT